MFKDLEKRLNNRLLDWILGGSYLGDYRQKLFENIKKTGQDAYAHILIQLEKIKKWYKD